MKQWNTLMQDVPDPVPYSSTSRANGQNDRTPPKRKQKRSAVVSALVASCSLLTPACGDADGTATDPGGAGGTGGTTDGGAGGPDGGADASVGDGDAGGHYTGPCTELVVGDTSLFFASVARIGVEAPVLPPVEEHPKTRLTLELYEDDGTGGLPPLATGTFEFATPPDDNYGTCQHCVLLVAYDLAGNAKRAFYPKNGMMELTQIPADVDQVIVGRADQMELVEVKQNADFTWEVLPGGDCYYVDEWVFDTRLVEDTSCVRAEQCSNEVMQVCDPESATCVPGQCSMTFDPPFCNDDEVCLSQLWDPDQVPAGPATGACYSLCDPTQPASCGSGAMCRPLGPTQAFGVCMRTGSAEIGDSCTPSDISTECVTGAVCTGEPGECARTCDFLAKEAGCDAGRLCAGSNLCERPETGDSSAVGEVCSTSSPELVECGPEGDAFRGLCMKFFLEDPDLLCERLCRTENPECPDGDVCLSVFSNPVVGICRPQPVCGDGVTDVIGGELCDDGNTVGGDGCSADCLTADISVLCDDASQLVSGQVVDGTTIGGPSGYASQCDPYTSTSVATYSFSVPSEGRLALSLESTSDLGLSVYQDCADASSELACLNMPGNDHLNIDFGAAQSVFVIVRGASPNLAGPFELSAEFTPALCGDGEAVGLEACDDGNTASGDGCSADCAAIEWDHVCASLPSLSTTTPNQGTTEGAPDYFDLAGLCSFYLGGGPERAYSFVAPSGGTLQLTLTQPSDDFTLFVLDGCGPVSDSSAIACSNFAPPGITETTTALLSSGQAVTVIVDGFFAGDSGPYQLSASFDPQ